MGHPEWAEQDSPFASFASRRENQTELVGLLEDIFRERTVDDWLPELYAASIPCGPINDVEAALTDPHTLARQLIVETEHPHYGTLQQLGSPVRVGSTVPEYRRAPQRGEHLDEVAADVLNLDADAVEELRRRGAFGAVAPVEPTTAETEAAAR